MRVAVSNLAIPTPADPSDYHHLAAFGIGGIEVAPTRIAPWSELTSSRLHGYRSRLSDAGLAVSSLQALLFGTDGLQLLTDRPAFEAMIEHLSRVGEIGARLGASIGVFGSPRNRLRGELSHEAAWDLGRERLQTLASAVANNGFALGIEPVPSLYGGDFLTHAADVIRMVTEVDHPALKVHLDTACAVLSGDSISEAVRSAGVRLGHFHVAEPKLATFDSPVADHVGAAAALAEIRYRGWIAVEMLEHPPAPMNAIRTALDVVWREYGTRFVQQGTPQR